jgi:hypothetical protein
LVDCVDFADPLDLAGFLALDAMRASLSRKTGPARGGARPALGNLPG